MRLWASTTFAATKLTETSAGASPAEVSLDIGPSTIAAIAAAGEEVSFLDLFCDEVVRKHQTIRRLQRKLDHQRRANNPDNSLAQGRVKPSPTHPRLPMRSRNAARSLLRVPGPVCRGGRVAPRRAWRVSAGPVRNRSCGRRGAKLPTAKAGGFFLDCPGFDGDSKGWE